MDDKKVIIKLKKQPLGSEREERRQKKRIVFIMSLLCVFCLLVGLLIGHLFAQRAIQINFGSDHALMNEVQFYFENRWLYSEEYEDLGSILEEKALYGMTSFEEDRHTSFQSASEHDTFTSDINMNYVGIGVTYTVQNEILTFTKVHKGSPAEAVGILAGDILKTVDGLSIIGKDSEEIRSLITGEEGTIVKIGVEREGQYLEFDVTRAELDNSISFDIEDGIPVLEISTFGMGTYDEIVKVLEDTEEYDQLIIDLRDNSGGFQSAVEKIASLFLGDHILMMQQINNLGEVDYRYSTGNIHFDHFEEIVVLINENSASASEVLALALKEQHPDTTLVGNTSLGKGVGQSNYVLSDGSYLKITTSKWLSPKGKWINEIGIEPDHKVLLNPVLYEGYYFMEEGDVYKIDSVSAHARTAQMGLAYLDYPDTRTDGYFDEAFKEVLMMYQEDIDLEVTGELDKTTYEAIISSIIQEHNYNPSKDTQMLYAKDYLKDH